MIGGLEILHEGIWKVESIEPLDEDTILVTYITAWFESKEQAKDPQANCHDFGPHGTCLQSVQIDRENIPTIENREKHQSIYEYLTEELQFETKKKN